VGTSHPVTLPQPTWLMDGVVLACHRCALCPELQVVCCHPLARYTTLTSHCSTWQAQTPLTGTATLRHACTLGTHTRVHWEHACLAAQAGLLDLSLCLRPAAHKEPWETWQRRSPPQLGGEIQSHRTCGSTGGQLGRVARSGAIGHMTALEPTSAGRRGPEP
jgi:hypothetical protein